MNSYIFECIRARASKFCVNMFYNCSQVINILELDHAPLRLFKSNKFEFQRVLFKLLQSFLVYLSIMPILKIPANFIAMG